MFGKMPIIVSHYTIGTGYAKEVENLIASLERLHLHYDIEAIESLGSWRANSNYCTTSVKKMLEKYPDSDILRVDSDAVFQQHPSLFEEESFTADVAAHIHDFRWHMNELLGGTIFFRNKPEVHRLVEEWVWQAMVFHSTDRNPDLLQELIQSGEFDLHFESLPPEYCKIFDLMREVENPVIEHFQASRRFKKQVNARN